jgi:predicted AlkP superfamily phosphohydrolase/phosphomutase
MTQPSNVRRTRLAQALLALVALAAPGWSAAASNAVAAANGGRLIVLGVDGADARTVQEMMDRGELPNLARLRAQGTFAPLGSTMPAESPVSWASLNSGQNPAKTGIAGFVKRDLGTEGFPMPGAGHATHEVRKSNTFQLGFVKGLLVRYDPLVLSLGVGVLALLGFLFVFAFLLKIRRVVAGILALCLGAIGGAGAWVSSGYVPREISDVVGNPTKTVGFWEVAAKSGVPCVVIDAAMEWDRPNVENLKLLAGLGVPDVRANNGDWFVYTTSSSEFSRAPNGRETSTGGRVFRADERDGKIESFVYGPQNYWLIDRARTELDHLTEALARPGLPDAKADKLRERERELTDEVLPRLAGSGAYRKSEEGRVNLPLSIVKKDKVATVSIGGQSQDLAEGAWSNWYHLTFELNPLVKVKAITRAKLVKFDEPFELYVDFLQIDPADPMFWQPVSRPPSFAGELAKSIHTSYETVGWACMTMPFKDREIDPVTFLQDIEYTHELREKLLLAALDRDDWRVLVDVESTPDRVQHMMYQFYDAEHPLHDAVKAAQKTSYFGHEIELKDAIPATYRELDRLVGVVMDKHLKPNDTLLICADHGFQSFRRQVHLNNWLAKEGYLVLREGVTRASLREAGPLGYVDWSKTRAYALGLGGIFVNLQGREHDGIVAPEEVPALLAEIQAKLLQLKDGANGKNAVRNVYEMARIHHGPYLSEESDLMAGFEATYRVSWGTTLGNVALVDDPNGGPSTLAPVIEDNKLNWSGDHVSVSEDLVRGIFFSNRKIEVPKEGVNLLHIAPTALAIVGVAVPKEYDEAPLRFVE